MPQFRLDASYWFVTYSQCPLAREDVLEAIYTRHDTRTPEWIVVARERHDDGGFHLHGVIYWGRRLCTRNPRFLDITGPDGTVYHPSIEPVKSLGKALEYVYKEDESPCEFGSIPDVSATERDSRHDTIRRILETSTSADELLSRVRDEDPVHYVEKIFQWERVAEREFAEVIEPDPVEQRPFHNVPDEIQRWLDEEFEKEVRPLAYGAQPAAGLLVSSSRGLGLSGSAQTLEKSFTRVYLQVFNPFYYVEPARTTNSPDGRWAYEDSEDSVGEEFGGSYLF